MEIQVELTTNKWHVLRYFADNEFSKAHRLIQTISQTGLHARIYGHKHTPSFGREQLKPEDIPELEKWLAELEAKQADR